MWLLTVPMLVALNGISPHLGLKSETSFAMYSNLRTEGGRSNHYIYPNSLQLFDFQRSLIEVRDSSVVNLASRDWLYTEFELRRFLSNYPEASITYVRDGKTVELGHAKEERWLVEPPTWFEAKFYRFRRVSKSGSCTH